MFLNRLVVFFILFLVSLPVYGEDKVLFAIGSYKEGTIKYCLKRFPKYREKILIVTEKNTTKEIEDAVKRSKLIVLDIMMKTLSDKILFLKAKRKLPIKVFCVNNSTSDKIYKKNGFIFDEKLRAYYANPLKENVENLIAYALYLSGEKTSFSPPVILPKMGIYHPRAKKIFTDFVSYKRWYNPSGRYWIAILFYQAYIDPLHRPFLDYLINSFEKEGLNVVAFYSYPAYKGIEFLLKNKVPVEVLISFAFKMSASKDKKSRKLLAKLDVPVINAINLFSETKEQWLFSSRGLSTFEVPWQIAIPEISALIEPIVVSGRMKQKDYYVYEPIKEQVLYLVRRVKAWINLIKKKNKDKKIVIIYYNHSPGKHNIGASYLNTFKSLAVILSAMRKAGYYVKGSINEESLKKLILLSGRNVGQWAPGELESLLSKDEIVKLPLKTYKKWYLDLPSAFRKGVERDWGTPDNLNIMRKRNYIILPAVKLGNVVIAPQPARGVAGDAWKMYHSKDVYPHHQYIAFYLWLKKVFKADAVIHLGTHGTLEWLPGKEIGISWSDSPSVLMQDIPNIYPYVVDDVGEGIQAKRRGYAVIIDHLTPPVVKAGLYKDYATLSALISEFKSANSKKIAENKLLRIGKLVRKLKLDEELGIKKVNAKNIEDIEHYLITLKEDLTPYGLHTFGVSPPTDIAKQMAKVIGGENAFSAILKSGPSEVEHLLKALNGKYIPSKTGNDPVRNPNAIPTGYNFYAFDPDRIPSPSAWIQGKKLVDEMIKNYLEKHKTYPRKVSVILWATETIRNEGINEAQILYLIGMKPIWDDRGKVKGVIPINKKELGRPRIDVMVHASGLYRDMFGDKLKFIDEAIKRAALIKEVDNFIAQNAKDIERFLMASGIDSKRAKKLAVVRVFSEKPGDYGTGVSLMTANTGFWRNPQQVASVFINRTSFAYGKDLWGVRLKDLYRFNLSDVDIAVHSISSNLYRALDNDDVFQYLGGVTLAVKALRGSFPETLVANSRGKRVWVEDIARALSQEMITRYFNPKWIKGMMKEGYAGAREMAKFVEYLWGWQVTTPFAVKKYQWLRAYKIYVKDDYKLGLKRFFKKNNPWAYQAITGWMLEAIRKGYWKADRKIKIDLARSYLMSVVENGVACCEHTCNNPYLNQFVVKVLSIPGIISFDKLEAFKKKIREATGKSVEASVKERDSLISKIATGVKKVIKGIELKEEKKQENFSSSGIPYAILLFSLAVAFLIVVGVRRSSM